MPNQSGKIVLVLLLLILFLGFVVYFINSNEKDGSQQLAETDLYPRDSYTPNNLSTTRNFHSNNFKISFDVPEKAKIIEKNSFISIDVNTGEIIASMNGTNFENVKDYFGDLKTKNKINTKSYAEGANGKYSYVSVTRGLSGDTKGEERVYFIYIDNTIYGFSTSDKALYPVLDQIVESFEYMP